MKKEIEVVPVKEMGRGEEKRLYEAIGALKMAKAIGNFIEAGRYGLYKQIKDSGFYKLTGKDWKMFCSEDLGRDQTTVNAEIKLLEEYGESFITASERIGLKKRDLLALGSGLTEDARAEVKKGVITIGDKSFKIEELEDDIDEFRDTMNLLNKEVELAKKEAKHAKKELEGIDKEHQKEIKAYEKRILVFEAMAKDPETPEGFKEFFDEMQRKIDECIMMAGRLDMNKAFPDPLSNVAEGIPVIAWYKRRVDVMESQLVHMVNEMREAAIGR